MGGGASAVGVQGASSAFGVFQSFEQAHILRQNAQIAEANIPYIRANALERARQLQVGKYLTHGKQRAGYAGRGLAVTGSVFDVMSDTVTNFDRDTSFALLEGELQVRGMQRSADLSRYQARTGIRDAIVGGGLNTGAMAAKASMLGFGGGSFGGAGFGTADPKASSTIKNWYGGGGFGSAY
jgi:hypothetical protein